MKEKMKKLLALLLASLLLAVWAGGLAEAPRTTRYSFLPGEILTGAGTKTVSEFLTAIQLELTSQQVGDAIRGRFVLVSEGRDAFTLRAESTADGMFGFCCSLTGDAAFQCHQDQLNDFMMNIVDMLADTGLLKGENVDQLRATATRVGNALRNITDRIDPEEPSLGLNLKVYLERLGTLASEAETEPLDPENAECPGAVLKSVWLLREEDLNVLVDAALTRLNSIPILGNELRSGRMYIGSQQITDTFLRDLFASMHGQTVLTLWQDAEEQVLLARLDIPDISTLVEDETFSQTRGVEFAIQRSGSAEAGDLVSLTTLRLIGLEGTLLSMRRESVDGKDIDALPAKKVYNVGEMDSDELREMIHSMRITIAANALNLIMDLPRAVFDLLVDRIR